MTGSYSPVVGLRKVAQRRDPAPCAAMLLTLGYMERFSAFAALAICAVLTQKLAFAPIAGVDLVGNKVSRVFWSGERAGTASIAGYGFRGCAASLSVRGAAKAA
jgi:hypothetical protein